ncbi:hypothetical protein FKG94_23290 [Exilibacterium tricleocarpae]|uniref:Teneurin-like YD-shell domain-containing protein n=1 Tax=Exilibacterium tricleocarpae TaxID=2591008 RepID=A0A545STE7_9GAMM|nr:RHS repeat-associated core domain-containing protein [Exilibacterium tricleocarpae]TQV68228.1 hypothetical protein FKG94_23290 [Exilibacterium tricleocarpae]
MDTDIKSLETRADAQSNTTARQGVVRPLAFLLSLFIGCLPVGSAQAERTTTYYHTDALGSVVAASDETGALLWRKSYRPYGEKVTDGEGSLQSLSFTGKLHDEVSGLTYMGARYYDPEMGRFMGLDPAGVLGYLESNPKLFNRYAYGNNNPYRYVDPDGRLPVDTLWDAGNVAYDIGKIAVGWIIGNDKLVVEGGKDLVADGAALFVPYLPAGSTKGMKAIADKAGDATKGVKELTKQQQKSIRSLEKQISKHEKKLQEFRDNPSVRPGMEKLPKEVIQKQQQRRINHLETEVRTFRNNIEKIKRGDIDS